MSSEDPFFVVRDEVQKSVVHLKELHESWLRLEQQRKAGSAPVSVNEQLRWTADEIRSSIKTIEWDIQDLEETVRIVESNPVKFKLDLSEVQRRKAFVEQSKSTLEVWQYSY